MQIVMHRFQVRRESHISQGGPGRTPPIISARVLRNYLKFGLAYPRLWDRPPLRNKGADVEPEEMPLITTTIITTFARSQYAYLFLFATILHVVSESLAFWAVTL
ncbi:hypothetical protein F5B21DRAFT_503526 [Xylaria acuta]|nr:hypothetical protein F5B21DRAFT_503526 [Xylaria acuta]